jgi:OmpA-OmpF porin, OOP family
MFKKIAIAATLAILSSAAMAADRPHVYAGGDIGSTKIEGLDSETSYGAFVGYKFNQNFAVEGAIRSLVDADINGADVSATQYAVSALGIIPVGNGFEVFGRLGLNNVDSKVRHPLYREDNSETKVLYGAGVGYKFSETISGRLEVQKPHSDITNVSAGIAFRF